jgi:RNA polymerase sigma factor (sigma-70 family)
MSEKSQNGTEDRRLIELAAKGDSEAVREVVDRHQGMVYGTCLRILGNETDAEDAAQATFILFLKKCRKLKRDTVLSGWLYRTAGFVSREHIRMAARRKRREEKAGIMNELENQEDRQAWSELKPELDAALMALPRKHREVVVLRYLEGKSNDEAAATLGMTPSAVSTRHGRALEKLRGYFQRRGIVLGTVALSAVLAKSASAASVPASLGASVMSAAAGGAAAAAVSSNIALMVNGALAKMTWMKAKVAAWVGMLATSGALLGLYGLQLSSEQVDALDFTEEQTAEANAVMAAHRSKYLAVEKQHLKVLRDEQNLVRIEIEPFPEELKELKESFWRDFDEICDDRQERVARRHLVLENLFPYGELPARVEISFDGSRFTARETVTFDASGEEIESERTAPSLGHRWQRFWGDREDSSGDFMKLVFGLVDGGEVKLAGDEALTFEGDQPVISRDFIETLNLRSDEVARVNRILQDLRKEYLAEEEKHIGRVTVTTDPDGTKHLVVPPFRRERKALDSKLWSELGDVLDARQLRLAKQTRGLRAADSNLFDWGHATYTITIRKEVPGDDPDQDGYRYSINVRYEDGLRGAGGGFGVAGAKQLPDRYRRLLAK